MVLEDKKKQFKAKIKYKYKYPFLCAVCDNDIGYIRYKFKLNGLKFKTYICETCFDTKSNKEIIESAKWKQ